MSRSSPGVGRVVSIINFIADHPGQSFTLTDIVRALRLSRATCHALLGGLVEAGYLFRASDKSYVLGPALIAMGETARTHFSVKQVAQPEMRALADRYDAICALCGVEGGDGVVLDRAAAFSHVGHATARGTQLPLLPQFGGIFFLGSAPADVSAWLDRRDPPARPEQREAMMRSIDAVRRDGFGVVVRTDVSLGSVSTLDRESGTRVIDATMQPLFEIEPGTDYRIAYIQSPIFDARRGVPYVVALSGLKPEMRGSEIQAVGAYLRETCDRISSFVSRVPPEVL